MPTPTWIFASLGLHAGAWVLWVAAMPAAPKLAVVEGSSAPQVRIILVAATRPDTNQAEAPSQTADRLPLLKEEAMEKPATADTTPPTPVVSTQKVGVRMNRPALVLVNPPPAYPEAARQRGQEGTVEVLVHISEKGLVDHVELERSSGHEWLDQAARDALTRWRFRPAQQAGMDVSSVERQRFFFELKD